MTIRQYKLFNSCKSTNAFSLIEALVVVALIGVLTSVAIAYLSSVSSKRIKSVSLRRTAQEFCNIAEVASAAGVEGVVGKDIPSTLKLLVEGVAPSRGAFKDHLFKVPNVSEELRLEVAEYLEIKNGQLAYLASKAYEE